LDLVGAPTFFLWVFMGVVLAKDGQGSFASCKCDDVHGYLMFILYMFFCVQFLLFFKTHVITQTRDIMRGVLVGNEAKEAKIQKYKTT
jgi:hypothetical protein